MLLSLKKITIVVFIVYCMLTCYTIYLLFIKNSLNNNKAARRGWSLPDDGEDWNPWGEEFERDVFKQSSTLHKRQSKWHENQTLDFGKQFHRIKNDVIQQSNNIFHIEIWGKAAIGLYLWEHIFGGKLESKMDGVWSYGFKKIDNLKLKFRTGPGVITSKAPTDVQNLVLILNGRSNEKRSFARIWLDYLPRFHLLQNVVLILLGDEQCNNDWLLPYMSMNGGLVNVTYLVYDSPLVDNLNFFQWPLGVATYRGFPKTDPREVDLESSRPYVCNFLGTVYPQSSRTHLLHVIEKHNLTRYCFVKARHEWQPKESKDSLQSYLESLRLSDLTLNPVGINTECYRIYEAMSYGSVPVIEDVITPGTCGSQKGPFKFLILRLLKSMKAPVIYVKNWDDLPFLIAKELKMTENEKIERRLKVMNWYESFKLYLREQLISLLKSHLLKLKR